MLEISIFGHLTIDEIEFVDGSMKTAPGGTSFYSSITSRILGSSTKIYSIVGGDYPDEYLEELSKIGVDISRVVKDNKCRTTRYRIRYRDDAREMYLIQKAPKIIIKEVEGLDTIYLGPVAGEITEDDIVNFSRRFKTALDPQGMLRTVDKSGKIRLEKKLDIKILKDLWILRLSQEEAEIMTGLADPVKAGERLLKIGIENIILSMGSKGFIAMNKEKKYFIPPYPKVKIVDPTGAGDVLGSAFLVELSRSGDLAWASSVGASATSIALEDYGIRSMLSKDFRNKLNERATEIFNMIKVL